MNWDVIRHKLGCDQTQTALDLVISITLVLMSNSQLQIWDLETLVERLCSSVWTPLSSGEVETLLWDPMKCWSLPEPLSICKDHSQQHDQPEQPHFTHVHQPLPRWKGIFLQPYPRTSCITTLQSLSKQTQEGLQGILRALCNLVWF